MRELRGFSKTWHQEQVSFLSCWNVSSAGLPDYLAISKMIWLNQTVIDINSVPNRMVSKQKSRDLWLHAKNVQWNAKLTNSDFLFFHLLTWNPLEVGNFFGNQNPLTFSKNLRKKSKNFAIQWLNLYLKWFPFQWFEIQDICTLRLLAVLSYKEHVYKEH